jgi:L-seryl-tRNA(Ser) seleniumtransferase
MKRMIQSMIKERLRELPAVHQVTHNPEFVEWVQVNFIPKSLSTQLVKETLQDLREQILNGTLEDVSYSLVLQKIQKKLIKQSSSNLRRVINGTGVILHTNLGRAVLAEQAIEQMKEVAKGYSNLEYSIEQGVRGSRHDHVEDLVRRLTGAEAAMVVNNCAAAVYLVLREMACGKEVIVSRGQLVEIGGSFRVSEIMAESGAHLREIGTTNKTHIRDYERAINENTALLMKVHTSNFAMVGFTHTASLDELCRLGKEHDIPVYEDLGSGVLYDLRKHGIGKEPTIQESLNQGADIVSFSGDKLLGGPQAGVIAGKKKWIDRLKKNQLARVLRVDKMTLAALEATFRLYLDPDKAITHVPALRDILMPLDQIRDKSEKFRSLMGDVSVELIEDETEVGGGSMPGVLLPTIVAVLKHSSYPAHTIERKLRDGTPAIIGRISKDEYMLDFRTIHEDEISELAQEIRQRFEI